MLLLLILHLLHDLLFSVKKVRTEKIELRGKTTKKIIKFPFHDEGKMPNCHPFFFFFMSRVLNSFPLHKRPNSVDVPLTNGSMVHLQQSTLNIFLHIICSFLGFRYYLIWWIIIEFLTFLRHSWQRQKDSSRGRAVNCGPFVTSCSLYQQGRKM